MAIFPPNKVDVYKVLKEEPAPKGVKTRNKSTTTCKVVHSLLLYGTQPQPAISWEMHERATFYNKAARKDVTQPLLSLLGLKYISPKRQPSTETLFEIGRKVGDLPPAKNMLYVPNEEVLGRKLNTKAGMSAWKNEVKTIANYDIRYVREVDVTFKADFSFLQTKDSKNTEAPATPQKKKTKKDKASNKAKTKEAREGKKKYVQKKKNGSSKK